jgi:hypothetical protein|tara:strand:+ start:1609 stop:1758 length:150 start_codon:yes stop_codon:yes gene_type:complete
MDNPEFADTGFRDYKTDITIEIKVATTKSLMPMLPFLSEKMLEAMTEAY